MDSLLLYLVVAAGLVLLLAGAYGAAPMLFARRSQLTDGQANAARLFALGAAFPLLEEDLKGDLSQHLLTNAAELSPGLIEVPRPPTDDKATAGETARASHPMNDELMNDLFAEIGMLRAQIQVLRTELGALTGHVAATTANEDRTAVEAAPRRSRAQSSQELPLSLRRRLVDVRQQRRRPPASRSA